MSRYSQATKQIGDLWVDALKRAEETVTTTARTPRAQPLRPLRRTGLLQEMPTLHEVVQANFELAERVLKAQKQYSLKAVEAAFPEAAKSAHRAAEHHEPARKPAARRKRSTARTRRPAARA